MKTLGNILWVILGGAVGSGLWLLYGVLWSITIVGIPLGKQCFKLASLTFMPFNKEVVDTDSGALGLVANIIWAVTTGVVMAAENVVVGLSLCVTIVGIPFGLQYFKLAKLSLMPFGTEIKRK